MPHLHNVFVNVRLSEMAAFLILFSCKSIACKLNVK